MTRQVVVTGIGAVSALGAGVDPLWEGLCAGRTALTPVRRFDPSGYTARLAGQAPEDYAAKSLVPKSYRKAVKVMSRDVELTVGAARFAREAAGLVTRENADADTGVEQSYAAARLGCNIGAGFIAAEATELAAALTNSVTDETEFDGAAWGAGGMSTLTPLWLLKYLPNMLACHVTIIHGCMGPSNTISCAEASGLLSISESTRTIARGHADAALSGGGESKVNLMGFARFDMLDRLAATGDRVSGDGLIRSFDPGSPGTILGEGAALLALEEEASASARGARPLARIVSYASSQSDLGYPDGADDAPLLGAIRAALQRAALEPNDIDAVVALGSGIPDIDIAEAGAITHAFPEPAGPPPIVTLTPNIGMCNAGAGALEAAVAVKMLVEQAVPPHAGAGDPDPRLGLDRDTPDSRPLRRVMAISPSVGGHNAVLIFGSIE